MDKLIVIVGPTAVGKTALSLEIAEQFNGEIISGDSMQIYRGLDIGTAKATIAEQARVPHHMLDIVEPDQPYSAAKFVQAAQAAIADVTARGKLPILVGGTGFYVQALLGDRPLADVDDIVNPVFVAKWTAIAHEQGEAVVRDALAQLDPVSAQRILPGQIRRLIRALLVSTVTGQPFSAQQPKPQRLYDAYIIGLTTEREVLYQRINQRVDLMLKQGLMAEVAIAHALPETSTAKKAIGYKEMFGFYEHLVSEDESAELLKQASRRYAKRQLTWFNNQFSDIHWFDLVKTPDHITRIMNEIHAFMS
ncbi:MAG: tRNA (adenosine(37)-N6)-dimethylallyltransferase MiaA [Lactobacillaceae bacterium]|jgi:tRNA dimethylallyltransferase|nr:tRNA (adenosine(37)-N6)-dimethylallyltransferase MiaA [Lactobacillaceae bacterium]